MPGEVHGTETDGRVAGGGGAHGGIVQVVNVRAFTRPLSQLTQHPRAEQRHVRQGAQQRELHEKVDLARHEEVEEGLEKALHVLPPRLRDPPTLWLLVVLAPCDGHRLDTGLLIEVGAQSAEEAIDGARFGRALLPFLGLPLHGRLPEGPPAGHRAAPRGSAKVGASGQNEAKQTLHKRRPRFLGFLRPRLHPRDSPFSHG